MNVEYMVTFSIIFLLLAIMKRDILAGGAVDDYKPLRASEVVSIIRKHRDARRTEAEYHLGQCLSADRYGDYRISQRHKLSESIEIKTWIDIKGDLVELFFMGSELPEGIRFLYYADQSVQYRGLMGYNDLTYKGMFFERRIQKHLQAALNSLEK